jgi:HNH endonuclease
MTPDKEAPMQYDRTKTIEPAPPKGGVAFPRSWWTGWFKRPQHLRGTSLERRLKAHLVVDPDTGCHIWVGSKKAKRYGNLQISSHRLAWELANGPVPEGMHVLHRCDTPACCNPDHLFLGTQTDNMTDKMRKGRSRNGRTGKLKAPTHSPQTRQTRSRTGPQPRSSRPTSQKRRGSEGK